MPERHPEHARLPFIAEARNPNLRPVGDVFCVGALSIKITDDRCVWLDPQAMTSDYHCDAMPVVVEKRDGDQYAVDITLALENGTTWFMQKYEDIVDDECCGERVELFPVIDIISPGMDPDEIFTRFDRLLIHESEDSSAP